MSDNIFDKLFLSSNTRSYLPKNEYYHCIKKSQYKYVCKILEETDKIVRVYPDVNPVFHAQILESTLGATVVIEK
jgi:hypothetical protein